MRLSALFLIVITVATSLTACDTRRHKVKVGDHYDLGRQNASYVSERQKKALRSLFNSDVPIKSVRWPSNSVIHFYSNLDFYTAIKAPLPTHLAKRYGTNKALTRSAWNVYRISVARGLDKPLIEEYFNSRMGKREIRGVYLLNRAYDCYGSYEDIPQNTKNDAQKIFDSGGDAPFTCHKKRTRRKI